MKYVVKGKERQGEGAYKLAYNPLYLLLRVAHDMIKPRVILGAATFFKPYFKAMFSGAPKTRDKHPKKLLQKFLYRNLKERIGSKTKSYYVFQVFSLNKTGQLI